MRKRDVRVRPHKLVTLPRASWETVVDNWQQRKVAPVLPPPVFGSWWEVRHGELVSQIATLIPSSDTTVAKAFQHQPYFCPCKRAVTAAEVVVPLALRAQTHGSTALSGCGIVVQVGGGRNRETNYEV